MIGPLFAFLTASSYALSYIFIRRAVLKISDASLGTLITIPMGVPFCFLLLIFTGQLQDIINFSWQGYVWLSLAGIVEFIIGRSLAYKCIQLVGANIASILRRIDIIVSVALGVSLLHESLSWQLVIGVLLIIFGITIVGLRSPMTKNSKGRFSKIPAKAFVLGLGNGVAWGLGPMLIKLGLKDSGSPVAGAFIAFLAATFFLSITLLNQGRRTSIAHISGKAVGLFSISGIFSGTANQFRFMALSLAPVSIVSPLVSTVPVFLLVFSFLFNRSLEVFNITVMIGTVTVVIGSILLV
ncbi:DMT family transporter [Thermodesulfobacteriota bacterium]